MTSVENNPPTKPKNIICESGMFTLKYFFNELFYPVLSDVQFILMSIVMAKIIAKRSIGKYLELNQKN
jgi:hypothetical protein